MLLLAGICVIVYGLLTLNENGGMLLVAGVWMFAMGFDLMYVKTTINDIKRGIEAIGKRLDTIEKKE